MASSAKWNLDAKQATTNVIRKHFICYSHSTFRCMSICVWYVVAMLSDAVILNCQAFFLSFHFFVLVTHILWDRRCFFLCSCFGKGVIGPVGCCIATLILCIGISKPNAGRFIQIVPFIHICIFVLCFRRVKITAIQITIHRAVLYRHHMEKVSDITMTNARFRKILISFFLFSFFWFEFFVLDFGFGLFCALFVEWKC